MRWRILLIVPLVALLIGPLYAGRRPDFLGLAFFYWYEFAAMVVSVWITFIVTEPSSRAARAKAAAPAEQEPRFSRDAAIRRRPSRSLTRAG